MSDNIEDFRTKTWWNKRVDERKGDLKNLIYNDDYRDQFWGRVDDLLSSMSKYSAIDIGCGYGRFSKHFKDYLGVDFSDQMLNLALKENPDKKYAQLMCCEELPQRADIVFEVNCLHSFGKNREEFIGFYKQYANVAVICIERNGVVIEWLYPQKDNEKNRLIG